MCVSLHKREEIDSQRCFSSEDVDLKKRADESTRIRRRYRHCFDLTIVNDNLDAAFKKLQSASDRLSSESQWIPVAWVY